MSVTPLTDLATVKAWLKITNSSVNDAVLTSLVNAVSGAIQTYCNRHFGSATYTETYNGDGTQRLWLNQRPVSSVSSVTVNGVTVPQRTSTVSYGWIADKNQLVIDGGCFYPGFQNVTVVYTAGYAVSSVLTPDLWQAACEWVGIEFKLSEHIDKKSDGLGLAGGTVYASEMPWQVKAVVDRYVQVAPVSPLGQ